MTRGARCGTGAAGHAASVLCGKTVVLTGASGYIASAIADLLKGVPCRLIRLSRSPERLADLRPAAAELVDRKWPDGPAPATGLDFLREADVIFHLAGQTSAAVAGNDPKADLDSNVLPLLALLEALRGAPRRPALVLAGTATQAGLPGRLPVDTDQPDRPITVYDAHKMLCEHYLEHYSREGLVDGVALRLSNVYGPGQTGGAADRGVLNRMVCRALGGEALAVYGDGSFIRDYVYIADVAKAFLAAAHCAPALSGRHFYIGSGRGVTLAQAFELVARLAAAATGKPPAPVNRVPLPAGLHPIEMRHFVADSTAFARATGWEAQTGIEQGLEWTIAHCLQHMERMRP